MKKTLAKIIVSLLAANPFLFGWGEITHRILTTKALSFSVLGQYDYIRKLGLTSYNFTPLTLIDRTLICSEWLLDGAEKEDESRALSAIMARSDNHFHDPLKEFQYAYLTDFEFTDGPPYSAVVWAQNHSQANYPEGDNSWRTVRDSLFSGLTTSILSERKHYFAKMFKALGHQVHLIQDMAVPDHVRNDSHPLNSVFDGFFTNNKGSYRCIEGWALHNAGTVEDFANSPCFPGAKLLKGFSLEMQSNLEPTSRLTDINAFRGIPLAPMEDQGLAEYANSNFFSEDTTWFSNDWWYLPGPKHVYAFPSKTHISLIEEDREIPILGGTYKAKYFKKTNEGEDVQHLLRWDFLDGGFLDDQCHEEYASKLVPRAVGYSAALLNYFFRGQIEIALPDEGIYASCTDGTKTFWTIKMKARNATPGETMEDGEINLVIRYREGYWNPLDKAAAPQIDPGIDERYIIKTATEKMLGSDFQTLIFENCPLPLNAEDVSFSLIYKGKLGFEGKAVAFGYKKVSEPTPVSIFNNTDLICYNGVFVSANSPELLAANDKNGDGVIRCADGEETISPLNVYLTRFSFDGVNAWESAHQISYEPAILIPPDSMYTIYVLVDNEHFNVSYHAWAYDSNDINCMYEYKGEASTWAASFSNYLSLELINNKWTLYNGRSPIGTFRGHYRFNIAVLNQYIPKDATCNSGTLASAGLDANVTGARGEAAGSVVQRRALKASMKDFEKREK